MKNINIVLSYLRYLLKAKFSQPGNSNFLSLLREDIIYDKREYYAFDEIESLKQEMLSDETLITIDDHGAGSWKSNSNTRTIKEIARSTGIPAKYGKLLFRLVNHFQPRTILELGTGTGISTLYMAMAAKGGKTFTIEGCHEIAQLAQGNFNKMNIQNINLLEGKFDDKLPVVFDALTSVDLIFIDGDHRKERLLKYFKTCLKYTNDDSIIIVDDINWSKEMKQAWKQLCQHTSVTLSVDLFRLGILFLNPDLQKQEVSLYY